MRDALRKAGLRVFYDRDSIGEFDPITRHIAGALESGHGVAAHRARRAVAEALDALGRYDDATVHWRQLDDDVPPADPTEALRTRVARLRSFRLRGQLPEVKRAAPAVIAAADARAGGFDLARTAELELARAEVLTDGQWDARRRSGAVVAR